MTDRLSNVFNDNDPDEDYFDNLFPSINVSQQSKYLALFDFNTLCSSSTNLIYILNFNIRSFNANSNFFFFAHFDTRFLPAILSFSETWFNNDDIHDRMLLIPLQPYP